MNKAKQYYEALEQKTNELKNKHFKYINFSMKMTDEHRIEKNSRISKTIKETRQKRQS